ncbi:unnamed protein product [Bursaphelenchus okinawaensis]|uniref:C6 domain-containing protein n=1 Tax=Bursaphelenchus okinawaensis TaxID=465554 RepID=A0A811JRC0_9BILA|nr:unnamed protein product [Bursaphelenchus okinawaensis]CAG9079990.1 unnamed protein product [Bursaphelenchus okinawaensis]
MPRPLIVCSVFVLLFWLSQIEACSPSGAAYQAHFKQIPCTQCKPIHIQPGCDKDFHDPKFACAFPLVTYHVARTENCGRATVTCSTLDFKPSVAQVLARVVDSTTNGTVWTPIGAAKKLSTQVTLKCGNESTWDIENVDGRVEDLLFVRCAHSVIPTDNELQVAQTLEGSGQD